jgi:hypothetical protein
MDKTRTPYKDIVFKIVSKACHYSFNHGVRCHFQNGLFRLWVYFHTWKCRRQLFLFSFIVFIYASVLLLCVYFLLFVHLFDVASRANRCTGSHIKSEGVR